LDFASLRATAVLEPISETLVRSFYGCIRPPVNDTKFTR
jgi:hypothetical protein